MQYQYLIFYSGCQPHHLHWPFSGIYCPCLHLHVSPQGLPGGKAEGDPLEHRVLSFYRHWTHQICGGFGALLGWVHPLPTLLLQDVSWNNPAGSIQRTCSSTGGPLQIRTKNSAKRCNFFRDSPQQRRPFLGFRGEGRVIVMNQYFIYNYHSLDHHHELLSKAMFLPFLPSKWRIDSYSLASPPLSSTSPNIWRGLIFMNSSLLTS